MLSCFVGLVLHILGKRGGHEGSIVILLDRCCRTGNDCGLLPRMGLRSHRCGWISRHLPAAGAALAATTEASRVHHSGGRSEGHEAA